MTDSQGWWYDRKKKIYIPIHDHAVAVVGDPKKYRIDRSNTFVRMAQAMGMDGRFRDQIIPLTCAQGFIRVRLIQGKDHSTLGWQFTGEPHKAFETLKRFTQRHDVGPTTEVTFTDFGLGRTLTTFWLDFNALKPPLLTLLQHWERTHLGGVRPLWSKKTKKEYREHDGEDLNKVLLREVAKQIRR